ncbi:amino acid adenylation domain-containing protein [Micromonospora sp. CPCC 205371]|nr:amino acid adenylation domain-containing protein [Micromonospora sp. CPCC 205371]
MTIENIYPLTALQAGMLLHTRLATEPGVYWVQHGLLLTGELDVPALRRAWETVFAEYEVLRTAVVWDGVPEPVAVVSRSAPLPWQALDLSDLDAAAQERAVDDFLADDQERGADFAAPSLNRIALLTLGPRRHQLVWSYHHLLLDGWSAAIVVRELLSAYHAIAAGQRPQPASRRPFRDFVAWSRRQDPAEARRYWQTRLDGITAPTDLGVGRGTAAAPDASGHGVCHVPVPPDETEAGLTAYARRHRLTLNTVVQGAWAVLLSVYSGESDVVFGVTSSGRADHIEGLDGMVGLLINTTPVRATVDRDAPFAGWLRELQEEQQRGRRFEHTPLPAIQACSAVPAGQQLFDTLFVFENYPHDPGDARAAANALRVERNLSGMRAHQPLAVVVNAGRGLVVRLVHDRARFDSATVERMAGHLGTLLRAIATGGDVRVGELPLLDEDERRRLVLDGHGPAVAAGVAGPYQMIAARAVERPDGLAVTCGRRSLSYAGLLARVDRLASALRERGAGPETLVGLDLPRGLDLIAAILAVWRVGAAYLPLDAELPADRLAFMLADSGVTLRLDTPAVAAALGTPAGALPGTPPDPGQLAYVIYTSGSTGTPKGVQVTHGAAANMALAVRSALRVRPGARVLQFAPASFDGAVGELLIALTAGATLVVATDRERAELGTLGTVIRRRGIDVTTLPPSLISVLHRADLDSLDTLITVGERLEARLASDWARRVRVVNGYGPTETTVGVATAEIRSADTDPLPIGSPFANMRLLVLDDRLRLAPPGVAGELYAGGPQLARGYGRRPALTAERFVADPHAADGSRLYRTGDRVRRRPDGRLEFLGRIGGQLKVRGFRVEAGEVEAALTAHPAVRAAAVTVWGDGADRRLVAYLVPADPSTDLPGAAELREFAAGSLPDFMVPAAYIELANLPTTPSGKLDRAALPAPDPARPDLGYVAPATPTEELLATMWARLLGVDRVGAEDDFFALGGHSLLATQVTSRIREVFGAEVPLAALFDRPTVRGLAGVVDQSMTGDAAQPVTPVGRDRPLPLSFGQQRLWFLHQLDPDQSDYLVPMRLRFHGGVDPDALRAALSALTARHEVLRTRLVTGPDGNAYQVIDPPEPFPLPVVDVSGGADPAGGAGVVAGSGAAVSAGRAAGPLIRGLLLRLGPDEHVLALSAHHVVFDEWSDQIFRRELLALYDAFRAGAPDPLPPLPVQYADFAVWQRERLSGDLLRAQLDHWREALADLPALELPTDRPRPPSRSSAGAVHRFTVPAHVADRLRSVTRDCGATMFMTLLSAFSVVLGRHCATDDVVIGTPVANRNRAEIEGLIGFFVNTLVLRSDLSGDPAFTELVRRTRATALAAYAHQDLPFEQLVDALGTERDRSRTPLFQVMFTYVPHLPGEVRGEPAGGPETKAVKFDLSLTIGAAGDALTGAVEYSTALFDATTIERMTGHLTTLLAAVAGDPALPLSRLPMLTATERQLIEEWNDVTAPGLAVDGVHRLIAARAFTDPDAVAVIHGGHSLTYAALIDRANRLAHRLRAAGAGPETIVGLCLERGIDALLAMVGVWQAGAAFVPLDPGYPADRLRFMLADSGASVFVAHRSAVAGLPVDALSDVLWLDEPEERAALAAQPATDPGVAIDPDQLAYVIYTSGSTGRPKGVQLTHGGLVNMAAALVPTMDARPGARMLQFASFGFDGTVFDVAVMLPAGGTLVVASPEQRADSAALVTMLRAQAVEVLSVAPSLLAVIDPADLPAARTLLIGTEAVSAAIGQSWAPGRRAFVGYGPTETTILASTARIDPASDEPPPIGAALPNTRLYVLDGCLNPVPVGVAGELYAAGVQVARGYGGRPALTAERFVADPFRTGGDRMYRTGDRVRWRADGQIEFLGRTDHQLKVRGFRIEPGEVEAVLGTHPGVRQAVVGAWGEGADRRPAAYLVPADPAAGLPPTQELRDLARASLPDYLVPSVFVELSALPLTPNGKLDRTALPAPDAASTGEYVAPATPTEERLAGIWREILGVERIGADDDFFALGGHSLLATRVVSRVRDAFGIDLALAALFDQPTVAGLARAVEARIWQEIEQLTEDEAEQMLYAHTQDAKSDEDGVSR